MDLLNSTYQIILFQLPKSQEEVLQSLSNWQCILTHINVVSSRTVNYWSGNKLPSEIANTVNFKTLHNHIYIYS